jgi:hypothetical protein
MRPDPDHQQGYLQQINLCRDPRPRVVSTYTIAVKILLDFLIDKGTLGSLVSEEPGYESALDSILE